jgi:hypothetical protein
VCLYGYSAIPWQRETFVCRYKELTGETSGVITKRKYNSLPRGRVSYYQEKNKLITKRKCELLPRGNVTHYQEEVWVITKRKCNSLQRGSVSYYQEEVWVITKGWIIFFNI